MSEATRKLHALLLRIRQETATRLSDATRDLREMDEIIELIVQDEPTSPGSPTSKSQEMGAVRGLAERTGALLEEGRIPGTDRRR